MERYVWSMKPTERQVSIARRQVFTSTRPTARQASIGRRHCEDFLKKNPRPFKTDMKLRVICGAIAEVMVRDSLGISQDKNPGWDGGTDFIACGKKFDVKTRLSRTSMREYYCHNVYKKQVETLACDAYVFVNYVKDSGSYEFCGWIEKDLFMKVAEYVSPGGSVKRSDGTLLPVFGGGMYMVKQSELRPFYQLVLFKATGRPPPGSDWTPSPPEEYSLRDYQADDDLSF